MRSAFTLLELMISVTLLSIIITFLYAMSDTLKKSNSFYEEKAHTLSIGEKINKTLYLDIALSLKGSMSVENISPEFDRLTLQTTNSVHHRFNPYVVYTVKDKILYRIESLNKPVYPFTLLDFANVDELGYVTVFRIYNSNGSFIIDRREETKVINPTKVDIFNSAAPTIANASNESNTTQ